MGIINWFRNRKEKAAIAESEYQDGYSTVQYEFQCRHPEDAVLRSLDLIQTAKDYGLASHYIQGMQDCLDNEG